MKEKLSIFFLIIVIVLSSYTVMAKDPEGTYVSNFSLNGKLCRALSVDDTYVYVEDNSVAWHIFYKNNGTYVGNHTLNVAEIGSMGGNAIDGTYYWSFDAPDKVYLYYMNGTYISNTAVTALDTVKGADYLSSYVYSMNSPSNNNTFILKHNISDVTQITRTNFTLPELAIYGGLGTYIGDYWYAAETTSDVNEMHIFNFTTGAYVRNFSIETQIPTTTAVYGVDVDNQYIYVCDSNFVYKYQALNYPVTTCTSGCLKIQNRTGTNLGIFDKTGNLDLKGKLYTFNTTASDGGDWVLKKPYCYQETATSSNDCGGLSTGTYACEGSWDGSPNNCAATYDGDYATWGQAQDSSHNTTIYINYTKPTGALSSSKWVTKNGNAVNVSNTLTTGCWNAYTDKIRLKIESIGTSKSYKYCWSGSFWYNWSYDGGTSDDIWEEAMNWTFSTNFANVGTTVSWLDGATGNLFITGNVTYNNGSYCSAPSGSWQMKDNSGNCVSYIDSSGNLWLRGTYSEQAI